MCILPGGDTRSTSLAHIKEYTFEVFMCAAILMERRQDLAKCNDSGMIFTFINKSVTLFSFFVFVFLFVFCSLFFCVHEKNLG